MQSQSPYSKVKYICVANGAVVIVPEQCLWIPFRDCDTPHYDEFTKTEVEIKRLKILGNALIDN